MRRAAMIPEKHSEGTGTAAEANFHDQRIKKMLADSEASDRKPQVKYYWATERHDAALWQMIEHLSRNRAVLELGCFTGIRTIQIGRLAKLTVGMDISREAVMLTNRRLADAGVQSGATVLASANDLPFADSTFDVVFGSGIIHHVDVAKCARELHRVLKPGGHAVFREPLGHNPLFNAYRLLTPAARTRDEHPLLRHDLTMFASLFAVEDSSFFGLSSLLATPFRNVLGGRLLRDALDGLDAWLLRIPRLQHYAWQVNLVMRK
jgi:SAM-dependent methyltransferase